MCIFATRMLTCLHLPLQDRSQGSFSRPLPAWTLCSPLHRASLQLVPRLHPERRRVGRRGFGSSALRLWLPLAQWRPQHGTHSPLWFLSAAGVEWLALSRCAHAHDPLPGFVFPVLLLDGVSVCRECFRGLWQCGPQPPVACGSESWNKYFCSTHFSSCNWWSHQVFVKGLHVCWLLGLHTGRQQVSVGCDWPM